ncbi:MAG: hypothetical protein ACTSVF_04870, partial [Candidatus Asgardarchaeia archaeon]
MGKKFRFVIGKKKKYTRSFKPIKKKRLSLKTILDILKASLTKSRPSSKKILREHKPVVNKIVKNTTIIIGIIIILFGLLVGYIFFLVSSFEVSPQPTTKTLFESQVKVNILDSGLANLEAANQFAPYMIVNFEGSEGEIDVSLESARAPLPKDVFILTSRREQGTTFPLFKKELNRVLSDEGYKVNDINLEDLRRLPSNGNSVIIIPTGFLPIDLAGINDDEFTVMDVVRRGYTVIYIGFGTDQGLIDEESGRIIPGIDYSIQYVDEKLGFTTVSSVTVPTGLYLTSAKYSVEMTNRAKPYMIYDALPVIKDNGYIIFVPNTLDSGWDSGEEAAKDVAKIISGRKWLKASGDYIGIGPHEFVKIKNRSANFIVIGKGSDDTDIYTQTKIRVYDSSNNLVGVLQINKRMIKDYRGFLSFNPYMLPPEVAGGPSWVEAVFDEDVNRFQKPVMVMMYVYGPDGEIVDKSVFGSQYIVPVNNYVARAPYSPRLGPGKYIIKLATGGEQKPYVFSKGVIIIPSIEVVPSGLDWKNQRFAFDVLIRGSPADREVLRNLDGMEVIIDGKIHEKVEYLEDAGLLYLEVKEPLERGKLHVFKFSVMDGLEFRGVSYVSTNFYEEWWFWAALIFTFGVMSIGILLRAKETIKYSIDIPEFEVHRKRKIYVKKEMVKDIFNKVNEDYGWHYMPLYLKEIKLGFRKIMYMGRPILIGDYNLMAILDKMIESGDVIEEMGLYMLKEWVEKSGFSPRYLAMFRQIRNILINSAMPFSRLGKRKDCDVFSEGQKGKFKIIIWDDERLKLLEKVISKREGAKIVIIFPDPVSKRRFVSEISRV